MSMRHLAAVAGGPLDAHGRPHATLPYVLVVERDRNTRRAICEELTAQWIGVLEASKAAVALQLAHSRPKVAVVDPELGGGAGMDLVADLLERDSEIVVIAYTRMPRERDQAFRDADGYQVIAKPQLDELVDEVKSVLADGPAYKCPDQATPPPGTARLLRPPQQPR